MEPARVLGERGVRFDIFYANSNIAPAAEYARRLETLRAWASGEGIEVIEGAYRPDEWERAVGEPWRHAAAGGEADAGEAPDALQAFADADPASDGVELPQEAASPSAPTSGAAGERCRACYRLRFEEVAAWAQANGYAAVGTTLSVSPYQYTDVIREELEAACARHGLEPAFEDWRPYYDEATRRSREAGMYRQNYCGCAISAAEAQRERTERKAARAAAREQWRAEHADELAAEEAAREAKRAERRAYDEKRARQRAILRAMRNKS